MRIRPVVPAEHDALGLLTVEAYTAADPTIARTAYAEELRDVSSRAVGAEVLVAVERDGRLLGGVTYVGDRSSPLAEVDLDGVAVVRMLAVDPAAQRRGVGEALMRACIELAAARGRAAVVLHSPRVFDAAHRLYERLGFERVPELDLCIPGDVDLLGFRLDLSS